MGMFLFKNLIRITNIAAAISTRRHPQPNQPANANATPSTFKVENTFVTNTEVRKVRTTVSLLAAQQLANAAQKTLFVDLSLAPSVNIVNALIPFNCQFVKLSQLLAKNYHNSTELSFKTSSALEVFMKMIPNHKLLRFVLGTSFFGTSGFKNLTAPGTEKYKSRGVLQITGEASFKLANKYFTEIDCVNNPELMSSLDIPQVQASILCILDLVLSKYPDAKALKEMTFTQFMEVMNPEEYQDATKGTDDARHKREAREELDKELAEIFPDEKTPEDLFICIDIPFWTSAVLAAYPGIKLLATL